MKQEYKECHISVVDLTDNKQEQTLMSFTDDASSCYVSRMLF